MEERKEMSLYELRENTVVYFKWCRECRYLYEGYEVEKDVYWFRLLDENRPIYYAGIDRDEKCFVDNNVIKSRG